MPVKLSSDSAVKNIKAIRGMNDYLPEQTIIWQHVEQILKKVLRSYAYNEIRLPIVEYTPLFLRAIGEVTDVVEKEMYTFDDRNGESLTLRPEGTAGCVRAGIENGLLYNQEQRLWYMGPMFRYERPQKGRYRQFHQIGVEVFGLSSAAVDAELIQLTARWWKELGIAPYLELHLNSIGSLEDRQHYRTALVDFLEQHKGLLDEDCLRRMYTNPLRVLDSKNPEIQTLLNQAPHLSDYLSEASKQHFATLCTLLDNAGISYVINERLVRGLDYYNDTVFEWMTQHLGSQGTVCGGGRYDRLVEQLGGKATPAVGFAMGMERLVLLVQSVNGLAITSEVDVYVVTAQAEAQAYAQQVAEKIRHSAPQLVVFSSYSGTNLKKQFAKADKMKSKVVLIVGQDELNTATVTVKNMGTGEQHTLDVNLVAELCLNIVS